MKALILTLMLGTAAEAQAAEFGHRVTIDARERPLERVLDDVRAAAGLEIHIDPDVREHLRPADLRVSLCLKDVPLRSALRTLAARKRLAVVRRGESIVLVRREATFALRVYDVRDLSVNVRDFPAPELGLSGARFVPPVEEAEGCPVTLVDIVKTCTGGRSWETEPAGQVYFFGGVLIVSQTPSIHAEIARLLHRVRRAN